MITCFYNGEAISLEENTSIAQFLQKESLVGKRIAVELNERIVPRSQHDATVINADDRLEIVHAIGGG